MRVTIEHDAAAAECVRQKAIRSGFNIATLDREHTFGMNKIPRFAAIALFEAGAHQLRTHCAVAKQRPFPNRIEQFLFQRPTSVLKTRARL
jgi:hypothetical protein